MLLLVLLNADNDLFDQIGAGSKMDFESIYLDLSRSISIYLFRIAFED